MRHKLVDLRNNIMRHITCVLSLFKCAAALCCACVTAAAMQTGFLQTQTAELHRSLRATGLMQIKTKTSTDDDATPVCSMFGLQPRQQDASFPRVIDCFLASNELDMLEIRLRELEQVVDQFVVLESRMTFRGKPKKLFYPQVIRKLPAGVITKVKYVVLDTLEGEGAWAKETMQRNALFEHADAQPGDILLLSDLDEIPKPSFVTALKVCAGVQFPLSMQAAHHYYSFGLASSKTDKIWYQPRAAQYTADFKLTAQQLRTNKPAASYANSSWHCSSCFKSIATVQAKMHSFSHSELDTPANSDPEAIAARVQTGQDLFGRPQMQFTNDTSGDMPGYIKAHPTRFAYLISRDVMDAGFADLKLPQEPQHL